MGEHGRGEDNGPAAACGDRPPVAVPRSLDIPCPLPAPGPLVRAQDVEEYEPEEEYEEEYEPEEKYEDVAPHLQVGSAEPVPPLSPPAGRVNARRAPARNACPLVPAPSNATRVRQGPRKQAKTGPFQLLSNPSNEQIIERALQLEWIYPHFEGWK